MVWVLLLLWEEIKREKKLEIGDNETVSTGKENEQAYRRVWMCELKPRLLGWVENLRLRTRPVCLFSVFGGCMYALYTGLITDLRCVFICFIYIQTHTCMYYYVCRL